MAKKKQPRSFDAIGLEYTWTLVDRTTLRPSPRAEEVVRDLAAAGTRNMEWSVGQGAHVLRLSPALSSSWNSAVELQVAQEVRTMAAALAERQLALLPGGAHPLLDPRKEIVIWQDEMTALASKALGCDAHGWGNSHRAMLEIPFGTDDEFTKLHTALRMVIPIIPALAASSPLLGGRSDGVLDAALVAHIEHAGRMPPLIGAFVPESVVGQEEYYRVVLGPIARALAELDRSGTVDHQLWNRRAMIARSDRSTFQLRVADMQECPAADTAIAEMVVTVTKAMVAGRWVSNYLQRAWHESDLMAILKDTMKYAGAAVITNKDFLLMFGLLRESATASELWRHLYQQFRHEISEPSRLRIAHILDRGCLAQRILGRSGSKPSTEQINTVYRELIACLEEDRQLL